MILLRFSKAKESIAAPTQSIESLTSDRQAFLAEACDHLAEAYHAAGDEHHAHQAAAASDDYRHSK